MLTVVGRQPKGYGPALRGDPDPAETAGAEEADGPDGTHGTDDDLLAEQLQAGNHALWESCYRRPIPA